ncbi:MAG: exonuclease SbcCD subunit D [Eubacterium sp.]|nr:exonuclease SbcCD subunit D [Eubacterium sp.]
MKILHTSDWHIGKSLNEQSLLEDQAYALEKFLECVRKEAPDVVIVAGDIYDRSVPSKEALSLVDRVFSELILDIKVPVLVIGGNHDGRERLAFSGGILGRQGLYIAGNYTADPKPVTLSDNWGAVDFWLVPFIKPVEYKNLVKDGEIFDYEGMYAHILQEIKGKMTPGRRNVLITHGLILGGAVDLETIDDSVRPIEIGGIDFARAELFSDFDYVALGHLHRPQKVGQEKIRYSGSLLKYSFSEWMQKKSLTLVNLDREGSVDIIQKPIETLRDLRVIRGSLAELTAAEAYDDPGREDYLKVILADEVRLVNPMEKLRRVYPRVLEMGYEKQASSGAAVRRRAVKERIQDPAALFADFYSFIHEAPLPEAEGALLGELLKEIQEED